MKTSILVKKEAYTLLVPCKIGLDRVNLKFDTGARSTIISAAMFYDNVTEQFQERVKTYCDARHIARETFVSASGDNIYGYAVTARNVILGGAMFPTFHYYLVLENKRNIALLGNDFLDHADYHHAMHGNIEITAFDEETYQAPTENMLTNDELIAFLDNFDE